MTSAGSSITLILIIFLLFPTLVAIVPKGGQRQCLLFCEGNIFLGVVKLAKFLILLESRVFAKGHICGKPSKKALLVPVPAHAPNTKTFTTNLATTDEAFVSPNVVIDSMEC